MILIFNPKRYFSLWQEAVVNGNGMVLDGPCWLFVVCLIAVMDHQLPELLLGKFIRLNAIAGPRFVLEHRHGYGMVLFGTT
jgi:hypothetical protein